MCNNEIDTTATLPIEKFVAFNGSLDCVKENTKSESDFVEIDFPKSRTIRLSNDDTIEFSVNYGKLDEQMKNYTSNNAIGL